MSTISKQTIEALLRVICEQMTSLWSYKEFQPESSDKVVEIVKTKAGSNAMRLPKSRLAVRGMPGVTTEIVEQVDDSKRIKLWHLVYSSLHFPVQHVSGDKRKVSDPSSYIDDIQESLVIINKYVDKLMTSIDISFSSKEQKVFKNERLSIKRSNEEQILLLCNMLTHSLDLAGFDPEKRTQFKRWNSVITYSTEKLLDLSRKDGREFEIIVLLNAPLIDSLEEIQLKTFEFAQETVTPYLGPITDSMLTKLIHASRQAPIEIINSMIRFIFSKSLNKEISCPELLYQEFRKEIDIFVDCIRLLCEDTVTICGIAVSVPQMSKPEGETVFLQYNSPYTGNYIVQPLDFKITNLFSKSQLDTLGTLHRQLLGNNTIRKATATARHRFHCLYEMNYPSKTEKLYDVCIALESLFLRDAKEYSQALPYRLSLRIAIYLAENTKMRKEIFDLIQELYEFRNCAIYGEGIIETDEDRMSVVFSNAVKVLKSALIQMILELEPLYLERPKLSEWWKLLELECRK